MYPQLNLGENEGVLGTSNCAVHAGKEAIGLCVRCGNLGCPQCLLALTESQCHGCRRIEFNEILDQRIRKAWLQLIGTIVFIPIGLIFLLMFYGVSISANLAQPTLLSKTVLGVFALGVVLSLFKCLYNRREWKIRFVEALLYTDEIQLAYSELSADERLELGQDYLELAYFEIECVFYPKEDKSFRLQI